MVIKSKIKGKKPHKNKPTSKKYTKYKIEGDKLVRARYCPRCGPGVFVAENNNRIYCGKCHFSEVLKTEKKESEEEKIEKSE
jgi:small subunit ribosomal protein S27Ae